MLVQQEAPIPVAHSTGVEIDSLPRAAWDELVGGHDDATYDQTACFSTSQWHRHQSSQIIVREHDAVLGGAHVVLLTLPGIGKGLAYVKSGPVWRKRNQEPDRGVYEAVVNAMVRHYCEEQGHYLSIVPRPNPDFYEAECGMLRQLGFVTVGSNPDPVRFFVNTSLAADDQMSSLDQKWRYNLRKALKNDIDVRLISGPEAIECFSDLHQSMVQRKRFYNGDPVHLLPKLTDELPGNLRPWIVVAYHEGRPVVGASIVLHGDTALYQFGASCDDALRLRAGYALQWWIVQWLQEQGVKWYDLGGAAGNDGLRQFKTGLVGKRGVQLKMEAEFNRWQGVQGRMVASLIYMARAFHRNVRESVYN